MGIHGLSSKWYPSDFKKKGGKNMATWAEKRKGHTVRKIKEVSSKRG